MSEDTRPDGHRRGHAPDRTADRRGGRRRARRDHRRARARRRRGARDPARRPAAARRARLLLPARRPHRRQRPARVPALLHRLPLVPRPHRRQPRSRPCRIVSTYPFSTPRRNPDAARQNRPHRAARAAASGAKPRDVSASVARRARQSRACRAGAQGARPRRSGARRAGLRQLAGRARPVASVPSRHCGTWWASPPSTRSPATSSLGLAAMVFKTGLLSDPGAADIGWARVPLGELHDTLARKALDSAGVRTELRTRVTSISRNENGRWSVQVPGETLDADTVVLAVPQREAHDLLPDGALDAPERLLDIGTAPILNVHVVYDRKVLTRPVLRGARLARCSGSSTAPRPPGSRGGAVPRRCRSRPRRTRSTSPSSVLRERYLPELERLLPGARGAEVRDFFVTRERTATFAPTPGVGGCGPAPAPRPPACTWPARGPPPGGPRPWRVRSAVVSARRDAALGALGRPTRSPLRVEEAA